MTSLVIDGIAGLKAAVGSQLGTSDWITVDQERIDKFADATGDHNWVHVDPIRAAKDGPAGRTIYHGFGTLSMIPVLFESMFQVTNIGLRLNYGLNRVRFPAPVPVDSRVRLHATLAEVLDISGGGVNLLIDFVIEAEDQVKPACVAQSVFRYYPLPLSARRSGE
jgi:acyl dehydratase